MAEENKMFSFLFLARATTGQTSPVVQTPPLTSETQAMERAAAAIIARDEAQMRAILSDTVAYDPEFDDLRGLRGPDRASLERVLREIRLCEVRALVRSDAVIPNYTINWACHYQKRGENRTAHDGAAATLRWHESRPALGNFTFQGPWPMAPVRTRN